MNKVTVKVGHNVVIGGDNPLVIQTMLNTHTDDIKACVKQAARCFDAGAEMVRLTVPSLADIENLRKIKEQLVFMGYDGPLVADVHFNSEIAIEAAKIVEKVRINPGNFHKDFDKACEQLARLLDVCKERGTAIRIGINHGSLGERITEKYGDSPEGMCAAAIEWIDLCEKQDFHNLVISLKSSNTKVMVAAYRLLDAAMKERGWYYPLHLGVTEAGAGDAARMKSAVAISTLLQEGIGSTIRISLTEKPEKEVVAGQYFVARYNYGAPSSLVHVKMSGKHAVAYYRRAKTNLMDIACDWGKALLDGTVEDVTFKGILKKGQYYRDELLQAVRKRFYRPEYIACPGCGRTMYNIQDVLAKVQAATADYKDVVIAVMGCIVNGPGEMADADYGYVGAGRGTVSIYRGKEKVYSLVPENEAIDLLKKLIEEDAAIK